METVKVLGKGKTGTNPVIPLTPWVFLVLGNCEYRSSIWWAFLVFVISALCSGSGCACAGWKQLPGKMGNINWRNKERGGVGRLLGLHA